MNRFSRSSKKYYKIFIQNWDNYNDSDKTTMIKINIYKK